MIEINYLTEHFPLYIIVDPMDYYVVYLSSLLQESTRFILAMEVIKEVFQLFLMHMCFSLYPNKSSVLMRDGIDVRRTNRPCISSGTHVNRNSFFDVSLCVIA